MHGFDLDTLLRHHDWCNQLIVSRVSLLTDAQYMAPNAFPMKSVHGTLVHLIAAEWIWLRRMRDGVSEQRLLMADDVRDLAEVRTRWADVGAQFAKWVRAQSDNDLKRTFGYGTQTGARYTSQVGETLLHVMLHAMQHRAELAQMLTEFGHSPGNIDLIVWLRDVRT